MKEQSYVVAIIEHSGDPHEPIDPDKVLVVLRDAVAVSLVAQRALHLRGEKQRREGLQARLPATVRRMPPNRRSHGREE